MSSIVDYLKIHEDQSVDWIESETCYFSTAPQCTPLWDILHHGAISSSKVTSWIGDSRFSDSPEESALQCVGLSKKTFDSKQLDAMHIGIKGEPAVRDWYEEKIGHKIKEVGIAVWKEDPRFRASLDGFYIDSDGIHRGIEIKITKDIYWPLICYYKSLRNKERKGSRDFSNEDPNPNPDTASGEYSHIWNSHFDQMQMAMKVTGVKSVDYIVCGHKKNQVFIQRIYQNEERWKELYKRGTEFLETLVEPLMVKHELKRIDPHPMELQSADTVSPKTLTTTNDDNTK